MDPNAINVLPAAQPIQYDMAGAHQIADGIQKTLWDKWGDVVHSITDAVPLGELAREVLYTALKILPIALPLLFLPSSIVVGLLAITAVVVIIKPEIFFNRPGLTNGLGQIFGCYAALEAVRHGIMISFVAAPQLYLVAVVVYLLIAAAGFYFTQYISMQEQKAIKDGQLALPNEVELDVEPGVVAKVPAIEEDYVELQSQENLQPEGQ